MLYNVVNKNWQVDDYIELLSCNTPYEIIKTATPCR